MNTNKNVTPFTPEQIAFLMSMVTPASPASPASPSPAPAKTPASPAVIEFNDIPLCNERVLVFDIRQAILDGEVEKDYLSSLVKAWLHLVDKREATKNAFWKNDSIVRTFARELTIAAQNVRGVSVKDKGVKATMEVLSSGMVKRILYSLLRQGGMFTRVEKKEETRPDEKTPKTRGTRTTAKKVADMTEEEYLEHMREIWKKKHETK